MKEKIVGIIVCMLLIATALPMIGAGNEVKKIIGSSSINNEQMLDVEWNKTYGGSMWDMLYCVHETNDGGFIACGERNFTGDPLWYLWLLKLDANGNEQWNVTLPGSVGDADCWALFVIQTTDGGYIACGFNGTQVNGLGGVGFLLKVDSTGGVQWMNKYPYGEAQFGPVYCVQEINDGYIAVGQTRGATTNDANGLLFKTDFSGNVQWKKIFSLDSGLDLFYSVRATSDGGYIVGGTGTPVNNEDYWLVKTDSNGNEQWNKTYGGTLNDFSFSRSCLLTGDGGYIMTGCSYSHSNSSSKGDVWLVKTDATGNKEWDRGYGVLNEHDISWSMDTSHDGGYIFVAAKNYGGMAPPRDQLWLVKTDSDGNVVRSQAFGGAKLDRGYYVNKTSDGGYIIAGRTESFGYGKSDGWIMKLASFDNQKPNKPDTPSGKKKGKVGTEYIYTSKTSDVDGDQVYYLWDWSDGNNSGWLGPYDSGATVTVNHTWTTKGTYQIKVQARDVWDAEGNWSDPLSVTMPLSYEPPYHLFLSWLFERFPHAFPILRHLLGY
jgi:hypothetical protein